MTYYLLLGTYSIGDTPVLPMLSVPTGTRTRGLYVRSSQSHGAGKEQGARSMRNAERSFLEKQICEAGFMD